MNTFKMELGKPGVTLTAYLQEASEELSNAMLRPAIVVFPGGSYEMCSDREAEPIALAYLAEGYDAFVLRYTVGQKEEFPGVLEDAERSLEVIHENAKDWDVDPDRIVVIGFSAGGHLAAYLASAGKIKPAAVVLGYPRILGSREGEAVFIPDAAEPVDRYTPPAFLFTTMEDPAVPMHHAVKFVTALQKAHVPFELHIFEKGMHGMSLGKTHTSNGRESMVDSRFAAWFPMSIEWLKLHIGDFEVRPAENYVLTFSKTLDLPMEYLLEKDEYAKVLYETVPAMKRMVETKKDAVMDFSIRRLSVFLRDIFTADALRLLDGRFLELEKEEK